MNMELLKTVGPYFSGAATLLAALLAAILTFARDRYNEADQEGRKQWHSVAPEICFFVICFVGMLFSIYQEFAVSLALFTVNFFWQIGRFVRSRQPQTRGETAIFVLACGAYIGVAFSILFVASFKAVTQGEQININFQKETLVTERRLQQEVDENRTEMQSYIKKMVEMQSRIIDLSAPHHK